MTTTTQDFGTCGCGKPADKFSSGVPECWGCWNWRKLDGPAARHWARVSEEFLSNVDAYDLTKFLPAALGDERGVDMIIAARDLRDYCVKQIEEHTR